MADFTYDLGTNVGRVRLLVADTDIDACTFPDDEVSYALTAEGNVVKRAAGLLYEILAGNRSRLAVRVTRGPVSEDLTQVANNLRQQAALWRVQADEEDDGAVCQAIISPSYEGFSRAANVNQGRHGDGPLDWGDVDDVVTPS